MTSVDDTTWSITLEFVHQDSLEYKYTRGSWEAVEKDAECGEIPNRLLVVTYGTDGTEQIGDAVDKWCDLDSCG